MLFLFILTLSFSSYCKERGGIENQNINENIESIDDQIEVTKYFLNKVYTEYTNPITENEVSSKSNYYAVHYNENDQIVREDLYQDNQWIQKAYFEYYPNQRIMSKKIYTPEGIPYNTWAFYNEEGNRVKEEEYYNGIIARRVEYYPDRVIKREENFDNQGQLSTVKEYHQNGNIAKEEIYDNGIPVGWWSEYDDAGREIRADFYEMGEKTKYSITTWNRTMRMSQEIYEKNPENQEFVLSIRFEYQYDSQGNLRQGRTIRYTEEGEHVETTNYN